MNVNINNDNFHQVFPADVASSLVQCEQQITFALQNGGAIVYWSHIRGSFDWLNVTDRGNYKVMLKRLRWGRNCGDVTAAFEGDSITVDGTKLYTLLLTMPDMPCSAYMLLHRKGDILDVQHTPYFFTSRKSRDDAITYINQDQGVNFEW